MSREALQLSVSGLADEFSCALGTDLFQASAFGVFVSAFFVAVSFFLYEQVYVFLSELNKLKI